MTTQPTPPPGDEIITPETLRKYGTVKGMKYIDPTDPTDQWQDAYPFEEGDEIFIFSAPLGTTAMLTTPAPEGKCECGAYEQHCAGEGPQVHTPTCPAHPRNRMVLVLPGFLAGLPKKPKGLLWCVGSHYFKQVKTFPLWEPLPPSAWINICSVPNERAKDFAYSLPQHVLDAIEAKGKDISTNPKPESEVNPCQPSYQTVGGNPAPPKSNPSEAAGTPRTDALQARRGYTSHWVELARTLERELAEAMAERDATNGMLDWWEANYKYCSIGGPLTNVRDCWCIFYHGYRFSGSTLREAIQSVMKASEGK